MWEKLLAFLKIKPDANAADLEKEFGAGTPPPEKEKTPPNLEAIPNGSEEFKAWAKEIMAANKALAANVETLNASLAAQTEASKKTQETIIAQQEAERVKQSDAFINENIANGRIPAKNDDEKKKWEALYDTNPDSAKFAVEKIPEIKAPDLPTNPDAKGGDTKTAQDNLRQAAEAELAAHFNN